MGLKSNLRRRIRRAGLRLPDWLLDRDAAAMRRMADTLTKDDVVLDLGGHVGSAAIEFSQRAAEVHSFEPNPVVFAELARQTARYPNIKIYNKAISDETGTAKLFFEDARRGRYYDGATLVSGKSNVTYDHHTDVATISFGDLLDEIGRDVTVVKMDIEGAEYRVLDAMLASGRMDAIKKVYVECHVDRIPELAAAKEKTLQTAEQLGQREKLDFTWL